MILSSMLVIPFIGNLQTNLTVVQKSAGSVTGLSSGSGGIEHALWRLQYEQNFIDQMTYTSPTDTITSWQKN